MEQADRTSSRTIISNEEPEKIYLFDKPLIKKGKIRISGPFTAEAVPSPTVKSIDTLSEKTIESTKNKAATRRFPAYARRPVSAPGRRMFVADRRRFLGTTFFGLFSLTVKVN